MSERELSEASPFDGIVCLGGEDWWYHNRGHFDFQIMRRLAHRWPVLFVNSIGVRMPIPGRDAMFVSRIGRKLASLRRGLVEAEPRFWVMSPFAVPGRLGQRLTGWGLGPQIRAAARRAGIRRPLLWVHCPAGAELAGRLGEVAVVLQRTDRFEAFPDGDQAVVGRQIRTLKAAADLVVYAAPHLEAEERRQVRRTLLLTHGVDLDRFLSQGVLAGDDPVDMAAIPRPRVGFIGGLDHHTFDPALFLAVAARLAEAQFVLVGGSSLPAGWCALSNVKLLGRKPYAEIARYMAAMDVLIMPWNRSDWIKACNPVKLKEYLAVGRPVVTTDFPALDGWRDLVAVADDAPAFAAAIRRALAQRTPPPLGSRLDGETWDAKADRLAEALMSIGRRGEAGLERAA
jgi:glycosyltransferase involved in cell wall biosynthesis